MKDYRYCEHHARIRRRERLPVLHCVACEEHLDLPHHHLCPFDDCED